MPEHPPQTPSSRKQNRAEVVISPYSSRELHSRGAFTTPGGLRSKGHLEPQTEQRELQSPNTRKRKRVEASTSPYFSGGYGFKVATPSLKIDTRETNTLPQFTTGSGSKPQPQTPSRRKRRKAEVWISPYFEHVNPPKNARILPKKSELPLLSTPPESSLNSPSQAKEGVEFQDPACVALCDELESLKPLLVQEKVAGDKWKLLVACIMLNVTSGKQSLPVFWDMMERWPTPFSMSKAKKSDLVDKLSHLGLQDVRAERLITMSFEYLKDPPKDYDPRRSRVLIPRKHSGQTTPRKRDKRAEPLYPDTPVSHLPGSGRYALDSYRIFCTTHDDPSSTEWKHVLPTDKELIRYLKWKWAVQEHRKWSPSHGAGPTATYEYLAKLKLELLPPDTGNITRTTSPKKPSRKERSFAPYCSDSDS